VTDFSLPFTPTYPPISHQADFLRDHARDPAYGILWEQGTGKSKSFIDNLALLVIEGLVDGGFVLAPNGPHFGWARDQLPEHWPADAPRAEFFAWDNNKASTKTFQREWLAFLSRVRSQDRGDASERWNQKLAVGVLCMSYDALMTDAGKRASWEWLRKRRVLYGADESQRIKDPSSKRAIRALASSVYAPYRRIMSGTPMDAPFDVYSQMRFLDPDYWVKQLGTGSFAAFKARFGNWRMRKGPGGREFPDLEGYRDLDVLHAALKPATSRVLAADVLDLPPQTFRIARHELTNSQRNAYEALKRDAMALLESGELVTTEMALILHLRLSQIGAGFVTPRTGEAEVPFVPNPRAELLRETLRDLTRPSIIWHVYRQDAVVAAKASRDAGRRPVVFDGSRPEESIDEFKAGRADDIIGSLSSGMIEFWTLNEAPTSIYYSRSGKLIARLQSERRNYRIGQTTPVQVIDMVADRTLDEGTVRNLGKKKIDAETVLGDDPRAWLIEALER
jgi:hypothetical protein